MKAEPLNFLHWNAHYSSGGSLLAAFAADGMCVGDSEQRVRVSAEAQSQHRVGGQRATPADMRVGALHMHTYPSLGSASGGVLSGFPPWRMPVACPHVPDEGAGAHSPGPRMPCTASVHVCFMVRPSYLKQDVRAKTIV